ncbi:hypothetical protein F5887DRAFT_944569 [Amanita rubescens]|nr:hypothetical protein F5887DRAFT_944569 [Amanita rubescens]
MGRTFLDFFRDQWAPTPPVVTADLAEKTVVVTGANTGLGFEASKHFARMNPGKLILACRSQGKGEDALTRLRAETGYDRAELWLIDQANFLSVKAFVDKFEKQGGRLDYLILNAGIAVASYNATENGWESSLQVNYLSTALLALLLLPHMVETARNYSVTPRMVVVSSAAHYSTTFDQQVRDSHEPLKILGRRCDNRYHDTKLLDLLFVRALADRIRNMPVIVNAVDPGNINGIVVLFFYLMDLILAISTEKSSRQLVFAALGAVNEEKLRGAYLHYSRIGEPSDFVLSEQGNAVQEKIWRQLDILSKVDPRTSIVATQVLPRD